MSGDFWHDLPDKAKIGSNARNPAPERDPGDEYPMGLVIFLILCVIGATLFFTLRGY